MTWPLRLTPRCASNDLLRKPRVPFRPCTKLGNNAGIEYATTYLLMDWHVVIPHISRHQKCISVCSGTFLIPRDADCQTEGVCFVGCLKESAGVECFCFRSSQSEWRRLSTMLVSDQAKIELQFERRDGSCDGTTIGTRKSAMCVSCHIPSNCTSMTMVQAPAQMRSFPTSQVRRRRRRLVPWARGRSIFRPIFGLWVR